MGNAIARRSLVLGGAAVALSARAAEAQLRTDTAPRVLDGHPVPEPSSDKSAGPVSPGRGSSLTGKVAVVTGAARGIGRAIAVEFAANGADVVALDIAGPVSPASNAVPATPEDLEETVRQIRSYARRAEAVQADIRDIGALRSAADRVEQQFGRIDIVVADAAIQRWKPRLEMEDADWRDVIHNNLNGTANTIRAFAPKMVNRKKGRFILLSSMQGKHGTGRRELFRFEVGDPRSHEIRRVGVRPIQHNRERPDPRSRRHAVDALRNAIGGKHGRDRAEAPRSSDTAGSLGRSCSDGASQGGLAATRRYFACRCFPRFRCSKHGDGRRIRSDRRRQCERRLIDAVGLVLLLCD